MDKKDISQKEREAEIKWEEGDLSGSWEILLHLVQSLMEGEEGERARACLRRMIEKDPASPLPLFRLGRISEEEEKWEEAFSHYSKAAKLAIRDCSLEMARSALLRIRELDSENLEPLLQLGEIAELEGEEQGAYSYCVEALKGCMEKNDPSRAMEVLYRILLLQKKESRPFLECAAWLINREDYAKALQILLEAFRMIPGDPEILSTLADLLRVLKKPHLADILLSWKSSGPAQDTLEQKLLDAEILSQERLFAEAEDIYKAILRDTPDHPEAKRRLLLLRQAQRKETPLPSFVRSVEEMICDLEKALDLVPPGSDVTERCHLIAQNVAADDYESHYALGVAFLQMSCFEEAVGHLDLARRDSRHEIDALYLLGFCYVELHNSEAAIPLLEEVLRTKILPDDAQLAMRYTLGQAYILAKEYQKAAYHFRMVEQMDSHYRRVDQYIRDLAQLR